MKRREADDVGDLVIPEHLISEHAPAEPGDVFSSDLPGGFVLSRRQTAAREEWAREHGLEWRDVYKVGLYRKSLERWREAGQ